MSDVKVTFGVINYNRLFYLKSCTKSLMESIFDYNNVELICIDDNSKEEGTSEYLSYLKKIGWTVINQDEYRSGKKDTASEYNDSTHINAYAEALNILVDSSSGDIIVPLQGDVQFIRKNWLRKFVTLFQARDDVGCIMLDAQRRVRNSTSRFVEGFKIGNDVFGIDASRTLPGAGDVMYTRKMIEDVEKWSLEVDENTTPENDFVKKVYNKFGNYPKVYVPWHPPAIAILTDPSGTNARVRAGKRYGDYWEAENDLYYQWNKEYNDLDKRGVPLSIEEIANTNGDWNIPLDENGDLKKAGSNIDLNNYEEL